VAGTLLDEYAAYVRGIRALRTAEQYHDCVKDFLLWLAAREFNIHRLPHDTLRRYVEDLHLRDYSPRSVRVYISAVNRFFRFLRMRGTDVPQQQALDLPRIITPLPDALSPAQLAVYFEEVGQAQEPERTATLLLPLTGLRINEMVELPLQSLGSVQMPGKTPVTTLNLTGKGSRPRIAILLPQGQPTLVSYLEWRRNRPSTWLWPSKRFIHQHVSDRWVRETVYRASERLGIRITPHTMRRTYVTALWRSGIDVAAIARMTGNSVATLMRHYLVTSGDDLARMVHSRFAEGDA